MAKIKVLAGTFDPSDAYYFSHSGGVLKFRAIGKFNHNEMRIVADATVEAISETNSKELSGSAGFAAAGALIAGPAGLIAGAILGGNKNRNGLVLKWPDGAKALVEVNANIKAKMLANAF